MIDLVTGAVRARWCLSAERVLLFLIVDTMAICPSPFFVWFVGRSGSTYLCDLLNSHDQIYCRPEDFAEIFVGDKAVDAEHIVTINRIDFFRRIHRPDGDLDFPTEADSLEYLNQIYSQGSHACGFKLKHPNQFEAFPEVVGQLKQIPGMRLIGLQRENVLKQVVSLRNVDRLRELGMAVSGNARKSVDLGPIVLDIDLAVKHARYFERLKEALKTLARVFEHVLMVTYEQLFYEPAETNARVFEFLGVEPAEMSSKYKKVTSDNLADAVANYDELVEAVRDTELEKHLG